MDNPETLARLCSQYTGRTHKNTTQKTKKMTNTDPTKNRGWTQVHAKGMQFLPLTFSLLSLGRYLCLWTISHRRYPLSSQCFDISMAYYIYIYLCLA